MDTAALRNKVIDFLKKEANVGPEGLASDEQDLIADGVIDSFGLLGLISFLEQEFSMRIEASDIDPANFNTVNKIVSVVTAQNK
jgi:acyl carrier protein